MATSEKDLIGWLPIIKEDHKNGTRASRRTRTNTNESLMLKRELDGLELTVGDCVFLMQEGNEPEVGLVVSLGYGIDKYITLCVLWFVKIGNVDFNQLPEKKPTSDRELLLTEYLEEVYVYEIMKKVNVYSYSNFKDKNNTGNDDFFCRRSCNVEGEEISSEFDYSYAWGLLKQDSKVLQNFLRNKSFLEPSRNYESPRKKLKPNGVSAAKIESPKTTEKSSSKKNRTPLKDRSLTSESDSGSDSNDDSNGDSDSGFDDGSNVNSDNSNDNDDKKTPNEEADDSLDDFKSASDGESSDHNQDVSDDNEADFKSAKTSPEKKKSKSSSPEKNSNRKRTSNKEEIEHSLKFIDSLVATKSNTNSRSGSKASSVFSLPKKKTKPIDLKNIEKSAAFQEVKNKLHTSTRLSSLPCREDEFTTLYLNLESAIRENIGCCLYVSGTPGVGKTATIREVIGQLKEVCSYDELNEFDFLELNGLKLISPTMAYEDLWEKISGFRVSPKSASDFLESYFQQEVPNRKPLIVLMDELDQIATKRQQVMYNFFNWPTYPNSKLIVIAVANTMDLPERVLSNKISSRLGLRRFLFNGYTHEQLGSIIKNRLEMLIMQSKFKVNVSQDAINFASRKVASVSGDARRALAICRRAVEIAEQQYLDESHIISNGEVQHSQEGDDFQVRIEHISKAINETINSPVSKYIGSLSFASKLILVALLLRMKRSGLADNVLGDIIDEMKLLLTMSAPAHNLGNKDGYFNDIDHLYGRDGKLINIRIESFRSLILELVENGILNQQNIKSERYRLISLNISEDEIVSILKRDQEVGYMLKT